MKKTSMLCRSLLLVAGSLSGALAWAQPYIAVPVGPNITILDPGLGSPPANHIGQNGIVAMKDPDPIGGVFTITSVASASWELLGDISVNTTNVPTAPPSPPAISTFTGLSCGIESYNRSVRAPAETTAPEVPTHARSMGEVAVSYLNGSCGGRLVFRIYKKWGPATSTAGDNYAPRIVGPNCWGTGLATFSVDQVSSDNAQDAIGFDQYYWRITKSLPTETELPSAAFYTSADRSSITIDQSSAAFTAWYTGAAGGTYTIKACYGRANPWDLGTNLTLPASPTAGTCVTKPMSAPFTPAYSGGFPTCAKAMNPSLPISVTSTNHNPAYTYTWTRSNLAWSFTPNATGGLTITGMGDGNPCTFTLVLTPIDPNTGCGTSTYTYTVNRTYNQSGFITTTVYCVDAVNNAVTINVPENARGNQTCWANIPAGWTWTDVGSSGRTFHIPTGSAGSVGNIMLYSCACPGLFDERPVIRVNVRPATPGPIVGQTCVNAGATHTYQIFGGTGTYTWTLPPGWTGSSTTNAITATAGTTGGTIQVTKPSQPGCPSLPSTLPVNIFASITQPPCLNSGHPTSGAVFTSNLPGTTWYFPPALTSSVPAAGTSATIDVVGTPGTYAAYAVANTCTTHFNVVVPPIPPGYVPQTSNNPDGSQQIFVPFAAGNCYQLWDCLANAPVGGWTCSQSSWQLTNTANGSYGIRVDLAPQGGCNFRAGCIATDNSAMAPGPGTGAHGAAKSLGASDATITVSPNPNTGEFTVNVFRDFTDGVVILYDANGRRVGGTTRLKPGANTVSEKQLAPGAYQVRIEIDGGVEQRSIVVTRD